MTSIAIVGSSDLIVSAEVASKIVGILAILDIPGDSVHIRYKREPSVFRSAPRDYASSPIELMVEDLVKQMGGGIIGHYPSLGGSRANLIRDRNLVRAAVNGVFAFLSESALQENTNGTRQDDILGGGTGHVITCSIQESIPSECYIVGPNGVPTFLGGWP